MSTIDGSTAAAPARALLGTAMAAVVAASTLTWRYPGVGWLLTALVGAGVVLLTTFGASPGPLPPARRIDRVIWSVLGLALIAVGTLRAAPWLWWLCLPMAALCGAFAIAGGATLGSLARAALGYPVAATRAVPWGLVGVVRGGSRVLRVLSVIAACGVLLLVFGSLLAGADAAFADILDDIVPSFGFEALFRGVHSAIIVGVGTLVACFLALHPRSATDAAPHLRRTLRLAEWGVPVGVLVLLFGGFVTVQATVGFGGGEHVLRTTGLTYAEYARQGFWQLLIVTALTLVVVAVAAQVSGRATRTDRVAARTLLGLLCLLTLVIVAAALSRMWAYEQAYGFSELRLLVSLCELWLGLVFVLVLVAGVRLRGGWVPRVAVQVGAATLLGLGIANPDHLIATENLNRYAAIGSVDLRYLSTLSADAVPALQRLTGTERDCVLASIRDDLSEESVTSWNYGRAQARPILAAVRVDRIECLRTLLPPSVQR